MKNNKEKILITGAHGFVGTALLRAMHDRYADTVDLFAPSSKELDLLNYERTLSYLKENSITCIYHLAAKLGGVHLVSNKPLEYLESNLLINYNIVHAALEAKVNKFITLGSSCSYSERASLPTKETELWNGRPENSYGICKLVLLEHLRNQSDIEWVYFIPPNIYGAGDHFGEKDAHFIPATVQKIEKALENGDKTIEVWGDGSQTRDFVYIDDLVYFLCKAYDDKKYSYKCFNISTGREISVKEIVELLLQKLTGGGITASWNPEKPTGSKRKSLSNDAILKLEPDYSFHTFENGISETLNIYNAQKHA